jgi:hypothetical protein
MVKFTTMDRLEGPKTNKTKPIEDPREASLSNEFCIPIPTHESPRKGLRTSHTHWPRKINEQTKYILNFEVAIIIQNILITFIKKIYNHYAFLSNYNVYFNCTANLGMDIQ